MIRICWQKELRITSNSVKQSHKMALSSLQMIIYLIVMVSTFYQVNGQNMSIIRGERDVFTKLVDCYRTKALCYDTKCSYCQCQPVAATFIQSRGIHGECVANDNVLYVTYSKCNSTAISQRWLWTKNGQFLNMKNLQCIAIGYKLQGNFSFSLRLQKCIAHEKKQVWRCSQQNLYNVKDKAQNGHLYFKQDKHYNRVVSHKSAALQWKRYGSNQTLCSEAVGCETFQDGSSLVILNQTKKCENSECLGEQEINIRKDVIECSFLKTQTQYLRKDGWQPLLIKTKSLDVVTNKSKIFLQWNLKVTPKSWKGIIVKVHFQCKGSVEKRKNTDSHCILIKYTGRFAGFHESDCCDKQPENEKKHESKTAVIIVCVLLIALVIVIAIAIFLGYRNKNRLSSLFGINKETADIARQTRNEQHSGHFSNPTYQSSGERPAESISETHETAYESIEDVKAKEVQKNPEHDYAIPVKQAKVDSELEKPEPFYYVLEKENSETA